MRTSWLSTNSDIKEQDAMKKNDKEPELKAVAYSVNQISGMTSLSKSFIRNEIRAKRLAVRKFGTRVLVLRESLRSYLGKGEE